MAEIKQGAVTATVPDHIEIPAQAGKMSPAEVSSLGKSRRGIGLTSEQPAEALRKNPDRLAIPGLDAETVARDGKAAEDFDNVLADLDALRVRLRQANLLLDNKAHENLRRVLAFVRAQEKFDSRLADLVPHLTAYFHNNLTPGAKEQ